MALTNLIEQDTDDPQRRRLTVPGLQTPQPTVQPQVGLSRPEINPTLPQFPKLPAPTSSDPFAAYFEEARRLNPDRAGELDALRAFQYTPQNVQTAIPDAANLIPGLRDSLATQRDALLQQQLSAFRSSSQPFHVAEDDLSALQQMQNPPRPGLSVTPQSSSQLAPRQASAPQQPQTAVGAQFSDPITSYIEAFAKQRAEQRENPPTGSGQNLLEQALRSMSGQFQAGGYTPAETEIFQTQAIEPIEQLRAARKQQVLQNLSARGISPQSGVAISALADVDRQMDAARIETQRTLAGQQAQERSRRMLQAIEMLSGLSDQENRRLNEGYQYRTVPLQLADRAFGQGLQAYNAGGNPLTLAQPLLQLQQLQQGRTDNWQEALGYLAKMFLENRG